MRKTNLPPTPLQKILGFDVAEEIYDQLPLICQIVLDLRIDGYTMQEIADMLGMPRITVYDQFVKSRYFLAKLKMTLEVRQFYKETHPIVAESYNPEKGYMKNTGES
jgi:predicted DNA-binding protein YlxM (UPF0122 family)